MPIELNLEIHPGLRTGKVAALAWNQSVGHSFGPCSLYGKNIYAANLRGVNFTIFDKILRHLDIAHLERQPLNYKLKMLRQIKSSQTIEAFIN